MGLKERLTKYKESTTDSKKKSKNFKTLSPA